MQIKLLKGTCLHCFAIPTKEATKTGVCARKKYATVKELKAGDESEAKLRI